MSNSTKNSTLKIHPKLAPKLAIVVPCYNEEAVIATTYNALCEKLDSLIAQNLIAKDSFLCFVDDGSKDKTCEILLGLKNAKNSPSLAEGDKGGGYQYATDSNTTQFANANSTLPLTPSAREGEQKENSHNGKTACHTESEARSISKSLNNRDISVSAKPQYDKEVDCREFATFCHSEGAKATEKSQKLNRDISPTAQYDKEMDCDDSATFDKVAESHNDEVITEPHNEKKIRNDNANPPHKILKLSRNYGQQNALLAGLEFVKDKCDVVVSMDCDLQDDINAIDEMLFKFKGGAEVVYGVRKARDNDTAFKKYTALSFYKFMRIMGIQIPNNHAHYRLLSKRACQNLLEFKEVNLFLRGIVPLVGYKSAVVYYERGARFAGDTKYSFMSLFSLAWDAITSFSIAPLRVMSVLGALLFLLSIIYGIYALYMKFFTAVPISGWTSTILILLFFGGMQFLGLGIMGEYIGKIYAEVKHRPRYFVDEVL